MPHFQRLAVVFPLVVCFLLSALEASAADVTLPELALKGLDPVELLAGKETAGNPDLSAVRGRYKYQFATKENLAEFQKQPPKYAIQLGGGCARMGLLSGVGSPARFAVHGERIYIFASDSCQKGFLAAPEKCLDTADALPAGAAAERTAGKMLVEQAVAGLGGEERLADTKSWKLVFEQIYPSDKGPAKYVQSYMARLPLEVRQQTEWAGVTHADVAGGKAGFRTSGDAAWAMEPEEREFLVRQFLRQPVLLLAQRNEPGFTAFAVADEKLDAGLSWVRVGYLGATTDLGLDPKSGRVMQARFAGRTPRAMGQVHKQFDDFRDVGGVTLPHTITTTFDGQAEPKTVAKVSELVVNENLADGLFKSP